MLFEHNKKAFKDHQPSETVIGHYARFTLIPQLLLVSWKPSQQDNGGAHFKTLTVRLICNSLLLSCLKQMVPFSSKMLTFSSLLYIFINAILGLKMSFVVSAQLALDKIVVYSFNPHRHPQPRLAILSHKASCCVISILNKLPCVATWLYLSSPTRCNQNP